MMKGSLVVLGIAAMAVAGCGGGGGRNDQQLAQSALLTTLSAPPYGVQGPKVICAQDLKLQAGQAFTCQATATDNTSAAVQATTQSVSDQRATVTINNLVPVEQLSSSCSKQMLELVHSGARPGAVNCRVTCPSLVVAQPGGTVHCTFTLDTHSGTVDITLGADGKTVSHFSANETS
jgi:hypothetical protein